MKKCDPFKDLILTDYIDGELDKKSAASLENHLLDCGECRAFLKEVKSNAALPFRQVLRQPVPTQLWDTIRQGIEHKKINGDAYQLFLWIPAFAGMTVRHFKKLVPVTTFPRMVPVFACLILMLLAGSVTLNTIQIQQAQEKDQGEYLISLLGSTGQSASSESNDLGTPIESYFL